MQQNAESWQVCSVKSNPNKKEIIMSLIGGNIAEMETVAGRFALTGEDTLARGSEVSAFARSQQAEYDNLAHSLVNHINAKAAECRSQAQAMRSVFASTNWQGNSRVVVENAEANLNVNLNRILDNAQATAQDFKVKLAEFVAGYEQQVISGQFMSAMSQLKSTYEQLSHATRQVAAGFEAADRSISLG